MKYFVVYPDVAGGLGPRTEMDYTVIPPRVTKLHYEIEGWDGDVLISSVDTFLITKKAAKALTSAGLTGLVFEKARVTRGYVFKEFFPGKTIPSFIWLKPVGTAGIDDFAVSNRHLIISERALEILKQLGIPTVRKIEPFSD